MLGANEIFACLSRLVMGIVLSSAKVGGGKCTCATVNVAPDQPTTHLPLIPFEHAVGLPVLFCSEAW